MGIILIIFIGKYYYELAKNNNQKNAWLYAVLGIALYYGFVFIGAFIVASVLATYSPSTFYNMSDTVLGLTGIPFGLIAMWVGYRLLKMRFERKKDTFNYSDVIDGDFSDID